MGRESLLDCCPSRLGKNTMLSEASTPLLVDSLLLLPWLQFNLLRLVGGMK